MARALGVVCSKADLKPSYAILRSLKGGTSREVYEAEHIAPELVSFVSGL